MPERVTPTLADRATHAAWVAAQLAEFHGPVVRGTDVWKRRRFQDTTRPTRDEADAYKGAWQIVRNGVTEEFREFVESRPRYNLGEWAAREAAARAYESETTAPDSHALDMLAYLAEQMKRRGEMIHEARKAGASWGAIVDALEMSRSQCAKLESDYLDALDEAESAARMAESNDEARYLAAEDVPF